MRRFKATDEGSQRLTMAKTMQEKTGKLLLEALEAEWVAESQRVISQSTLVPGKPELTNETRVWLRAQEHPAVFCGKRPVIVTAFSEQAKVLVASLRLQRILTTLGYEGSLRYAMVRGDNIDWSGSVSCVSVRGNVGGLSPSGGETVAVVMNDPDGALAEILVLFQEFAQALEPRAHEVEDAPRKRLADLAEVMQAVSRGDVHVRLRESDPEPVSTNAETH